MHILMVPFLDIDIQAVMIGDLVGKWQAYAPNLVAEFAGAKTVKGIEAVRKVWEKALSVEGESPFRDAVWVYIARGGNF